MFHHLHLGHLKRSCCSSRDHPARGRRLLQLQLPVRIQLVALIEIPVAEERAGVGACQQATLRAGAVMREGEQTAAAPAGLTADKNPPPLWAESWCTKAYRLDCTITPPTMRPQPRPNLSTFRIHETAGWEACVTALAHAACQYCTGHRRSRCRCCGWPSAVCHVSNIHQPSRLIALHQRTVVTEPGRFITFRDQANLSSQCLILVQTDATTSVGASC